MADSPKANREIIHERVRAPRGNRLTCKGWAQEAALRMLMNSLDKDVAEYPENFLGRGYAAKPARDWDSYHAMHRSLEDLKNDETLLVQSGQPAGVFKTRPAAPRVVIAGSNPGAPASGVEPLPEDQRLGLDLFGLDAAQSWTNIGSQQALHTAFQTFAAAGRAHFRGDLSGKLIVSGGLGASGGILPLAATLQGAASLGIDVNAEMITRSVRAGACDFCVNSLDEALRILKNAVRQKQPVSVGLAGNCAVIIPELASRGVVPDILTDLTGAGDLLNGYFPAGMTLAEAEKLRQTNPEEYLRRASESLAEHIRGMYELEKLGSVTFDFGNNLWAIAKERADAREAHGWPGYFSAYLRPAFEEGRVPLRWVALSGERRDIERADDLLLELFPDDAMLTRWIRQAQKYVRYQGLPARVGWLGPEQRALYTEGLNAFVAKGEITAPIVVARDQLLCDSGTLPFPTLNGLREATSAKSPQSLVDALSSLSSGASWVSIQGSEKDADANSCRTTQAVVIDGASGALPRFQNVLARDCTFGLLGRYSQRE